MRLMLTRPRGDSERVAERLREIGVESTIEPMIEIEPIASDIDLANVQAVLLTSANALAALTGLDPTNLPPILTVGDATASAARSAGLVLVESADGDASSLVELVRARLDPTAGPLLYLHGDPVSVDLAALLADTSHEVRAQRVYRQRPAPHLTEAGKADLTQARIDGVAFFSANTAERFATLTDQGNWMDSLGRLTAFCLSQNVAVALRELPWAQIRCAARPRLDAMLEMVAQAATADQKADNTTDQER